MFLYSLVLLPVLYEAALSDQLMHGLRRQPSLLDRHFKACIFARQPAPPLDSKSLEDDLGLLPGK